MPQAKSKLRSNSGQSLLIALMVMFILVLLGSLFVTLIARNLSNAVRSGDVLTARQMAEAGIRYADKMLTYGDDGADWRPAPDNLDPAANSTHPDIQWLQPYNATSAPNGGFTAFRSGNGRFLLRVTYNPDPADPASRYIKIESIGRAGYVDASDPTTLAQAGPVRLRQELTAFKPIGITDYARFVTNKQKRSDPLSLGRAVGSSPLRFGGTLSGVERGGGIRVNGNLVWKGKVDVHLRAVRTQENDLLPVDRVEVAGEITHEPGSEVSLVIDGVTQSQNAHPTRLADSTLDPDFTTFGGFYRDGSDTPERFDTNDPLYQGHARAVKRLEPPLLDQEDPSSGTTRYRRLTLQSGFWAHMGGRLVNSANYGYGDGLYINNRSDVQQEGSSIFGGGQTLQAEWTHPDNQGSWHGPYYIPPGAVIRINPDETLTITRTDKQRNNQKYVWYDYDSASNTLHADPGHGPTFNMPYPKNGVIFAEGNIRISGTVAAERQLTVVSNETIYIEGNILKADSDTSAVALLARRNVVVNTTQFLSVPPLNVSSWESIPGGGLPPYAWRVTTSPDSAFRGQFVLGHWYDTASIRNPADYPAWGDGKKLHLFVRHASSGASACINMFVNGAVYSAGTDPFYLMDDVYTQFSPVFEGQVWGLAFGASGPDVNSSTGAVNTLDIALNQTGVAQSRGDYLLESLAVVPMDVNIQALCYAQEGCFFVIPGQWFNSNSADTEENYTATRRRPPYVKNPAFPFYGEPLDIKITVDGAVTENVPADDGCVEEWMRHWSNIPAKYGSSSQDTAHAGDGLSYLYDSHLGFPLGAGSAPIRTDSFNRALPVTPKLPCSPDLIYVGRMSS